MTTNRRTAQSLRTQSPCTRGFMLIEALVAIMIFSIGVLGIVGLQAAMTKSQTDSKFRADAAFLAQRLVGSMWSDRSGLDKYDTGAGCGSHARCNEWVSQVEDALPQGTATVGVTTLDTDGAGRVIAAEVQVTINWTPPGEDKRSFTTTSTILGNR